MKIEIKNRFTDSVLFAYEAEGNTLAITLRMALEAQTNLRRADLRGADLSCANLSCADLSDADLSYANLRGADLSYADLRGADLSYANLSCADLSCANLIDADLSYANLSGADLSYADLSCANLSGADLSYADLSCANLRGADLSYANLRGADLSGADGKNLRATPDQSIENLDKVRAIILDDSNRLEMGHWHGEDSWTDKTCAEETVCGTTHCLAGWLQVCSTDQTIRKMDTELAGILCAPVAAKMFFRDSDEVLKWLDTRAYATEAKPKAESL